MLLLVPARTYRAADFLTAAGRMGLDLVVANSADGTVSDAQVEEKLKDYPGWRLAGGLLTSRKRLALAMGCAEDEVAHRFEEGLGRLIEPVIVEDAPCQQVVLTGDAVDLDLHGAHHPWFAGAYRGEVLIG